MTAERRELVGLLAADLDAPVCAQRLEEWCRSNGATLDDVVDSAEGLVHEDPVTARLLAQAVGTLVAAQVDPGVSLTAARASLLDGQVLAIEGQLDEALFAVQAARRGFLAAGQPWRAARTDLGRMHILNELGRTAEAIAVGGRLMSDVDRLERSATDAPPPDDPRWLRALCLTNLAVCHTFAGSYALAASANAAAERLLTALGRYDEVAILRQNQAEHLIEEGRAAEARDLLEHVVEVFAAAGQTLLQARCLSDLGRAESALGATTAALDAFDRAERLLVRLDVVTELDQLQLNKAQAYLALNLHAEALTVFEHVAGAAAASGLARYHAVALAGQGAALAALGRWPQAGATLAAAAELHDEVANHPLATAARVELAAVTAQGGDPHAALALLRRLAETTAGPDHRLSRVYVLLGLADVAAVEEGEEALAEAQHLVDHLALPPLRFRVGSRLGALRRRQGRTAEARSLLETAAADAELQRALLPSQQTRTSFLRDKTRIFDELVGLELDCDPHGAVPAWAAAERARSRSLLDLVHAPGPGRVSRSASRSASRRASSEESSALAGELSAVYDEMMDRATIGRAGVGGGGGGGPSDAALRRRADELQARLALSRVSGVGDEALEQGRLLGYPELRGRLSPDTVLIGFHVVDGDVVRFDDLGGTFAVRPVTRMSTVTTLLHGLDQQWRRFRAGEDFAVRHATRLLALAERDLGLLGDALLGGLPLDAARHRGADRLAVVAAPPLHGVPFHALQQGGRPVLADWEVVTAPSGSVLGTLPTWRLDRSRPSLALAPSDASIPQAVQEVTALGALLPRLQCLLGEEATGAALPDAVRGAGIVHVACHGMHQPGDGSFSALRFADGWFTAADAAALDLEGALVCLSACETGRQQAVGGEAVGLPQALLAAGAAAVVASLWNADDAVTSTLMQCFYRQLGSGASPAAALRTAQLATAAEHPHPYYWAPFTVTGACRVSPDPTGSPLESTRSLP